MVFSSNTFLFCFLPIMLLVYHIVRKEVRSFVLLLGSCLFYAWIEPKALIVLFSVILFSYGNGIVLSKCCLKVVRRIILIVAILINIGILVYFKYANFIIEIFNLLTSKGIILQKIMLPLGISFFVFQSISYMVDIYRNEIKPEKNFVCLALYFAMFPKVTQGPIMKYSAMIEDLQRMELQTDDLYEGIRRFIIGISKKVLLADILGGVADSIFSLAPTELSVSLAWGGAFAYTLQIYFDFSGYSDMAIGLGRMFGFRLMENFNHPYISTSITEFWRRWHISLSCWFRDYIYIPLGGNRRGNQYINLLIVFIVTGIWHGAALTFIIWGLFHGIIRIIEKWISNKNITIKIPVILRWMITILLVMIGWVLFRSSSLKEFFSFIKAMFGFGSVSPYTIGWFYNTKVIIVSIVALLAAVSWKELFPNIWCKWRDKNATQLIMRLALLVMFIASIVLTMTSTYTSFIYFQF